MWFLLLRVVSINRAVELIAVSLFVRTSVRYVDAVRTGDGCVGYAEDVLKLYRYN